MENPNAIHYRDLITPDESINNLIKQLEALIAKYEEMRSKIQSAATDAAKSMEGVSSATEENRDAIKETYEQSERLYNAYKKVTTEEQEHQRTLIRLKDAVKEQNEIDKAAVRIATSKEGSYNRLSAQYKLNKIRLNEMSEAERHGTEEGRKLEAETKAIYEQMNKLQLATGKAQLQVGHYERGLGSALGVNSQLVEAMTDSTAVTAKFKGMLGVLATPLGAAIGLVGAGVAAFKLWKETVNSTQTTGDNLAVKMAGWHNVWDRFSKAVATFDFKYFIEGAAEAAAAGQKLAQVLDSTFERSASIRLRRAEMTEENAMLEEAAKNTALSYEERLKAAKQYIANIKPLYEEEIETAKRVRDAQLENLFALTNQRKFATNEEREAAKEEFAEKIKLYNINEQSILQAQEYLSLLHEEEKAKAGIYGSYGSEVIKEVQQKIQNLGDIDLDFVEFVKQYQLTNDAQVEAYVKADEDYGRAKGALYNENKRFITLIDGIEGQHTKQLQAEEQARTKAAQDAAKAKKKAKEDEAKATAAALADKEKAAKAEIAAQNALAQSQLQAIELQISNVEKGTVEELKLRIAAIEKRRQIEVAKNSQIAEELRQSEAAINAKYDKEILATESSFYVTKAKTEFEQQQALDAALFANTEASEDAKTKFRLNQEKARLQKILELNEQAADKMSETEIATVKATIEGIDKELASAKTDYDLFDIFGGKNLSKDYRDAISTAVSTTIDGINTIIEAWQEEAEARVESAQSAVDAAQEELDAEIEARDAGYENNVADAQRNLELKQAELDEAQKQQEAATNAQLALDTITQTASLITASANIWASMTPLGIPGIALAIASIGTMWGSFAYSKIKAAQLAKESYGEGTVELLEGGSHASGHDIDMGTTPDGKRRRAEGGEYFAIVNKRNSRKYRDVIPDVINSFNDGTFAEKYARTSEAMSGVALTLMGGTDVSKLERDVKAIRQQGAEMRYVDAAGNIVVRYKNLTRVIKS